MLDLIGFWTAVSVFTLWILIPCLAVASKLLDVLVKQAIGKEGAGNCLLQVTSSYESAVVLFKKITISFPRAFFGLGVMGGGIALFFVLIHCACSGDTPVEVAIWIGTNTAPFFSWVGILAGCYVAVLYAIRYGYKVAQVVEKVNNMEEAAEK